MHPNRVAIVVQARTSSRRLPGKVLASLFGVPTIVRMVERLRRVKRAAHILVATSSEPSDDRLADVCQAHRIPVRRGPLHDVLGRVAAAIPAECDVVVRLTADCPLVDPSLVDRHLEVYASQPADSYTSNAVCRTFPDGLDVEVTSRSLIERAAREATDPADREHVTPWIRRNAPHVAVTQPLDLSAVRWVLDTAEDLPVIDAIYSALYPETPAFSSTDVYRLQVSAPHLIRLGDDGSVRDMVERMRQLLSRQAAE